MSSESSAGEVKSKTTGRRPTPLGWRLVVLLFVLAGLVFLREPVHFALELRRELEADVPDQGFVTGAVDLPLSRFQRVVQDFWACGKIAHRQEAIQLVSVRVLIYPEMKLEPFEPMIAAAVTDVDSTVRDLAIPLSIRLGPARAIPRLTAQLNDPDHQVRLVAMRHLQRLGATNALPHIASQLDESDPLLVYEAVSWMQRLTGVDHGMGSGRITRRQLSMAAHVDQGFEGFHRARQSAVEWWAVQPVVQLSTPISVAEERPRRFVVPIEEFGLIGADQKPFECRDLADRPVLLYFFTSWDIYGAPEIKRFRQLTAGRLRLLGIALDAIPHGHNISRLMADLGREFPDDFEGDSPLSRDEIFTYVNNRLAEHSITFPVAFDVDGQLTRVLQGGEIPAYVYLDSEHRMVRRISGKRRAESLVDVAAHYDLLGAGPSPSRKKATAGLLLGSADSGAGR